jgi:hypothetical protein
VELSAILLARVIGFFDTADVSPRHGMFFPELVKELVQHCNFQKFPITLEDWNNPEGAQFVVGKLDKTAIEKLIIYPNGLQVETRNGTTESKRVLEEILGWARDKFGILYSPATVKRWAYVSDLTFTSDVPLLMTGPLERLSRGVSEAIGNVVGEEVIYEPLGLNIGHDPLLRKYGRAVFSIHRRAEVPLRDNKYFSEAPLPTEIHLDLLAQYERDVAQMLNVR